MPDAPPRSRSHSTVLVQRSDLPAGVRSPAPAGASRQLKATAFHEAGHAVAALALGFSVKVATIEPGSDPETGRPSSGHIEYDPQEILRGAEQDVRRLAVETLIKRQAIVSFAGPAAQAIARPGTRIRAGAIGDHEHIARTIGLLCRDMESEKALRRWCENEARGLVKARWSHIEAVALALLERRTLAGANVAEIVARIDRAEAERAAAMRPDVPLPSIAESEEHMRRKRRRAKGFSRRNLADAVLAEALAALARQEQTPLTFAVIADAVADRAALRDLDADLAVDRLRACLKAEGDRLRWRPFERAGAKA
jgi:hypothetical protein